MRAAAIDRFGPSSLLTLHTLPVPRLDAHEVLIEVHAAGVGIWDAKIRDGTWADGKVKFPLVLGSDGAGIVVAKGESVKSLLLGDIVWAYQYENAKGGFYAEYTAVAAENAAPKPKSLDILHAGAGAVTSLTAQQGIDDHLKIKPEETVLIFGASGAVGTLGVQFAKLRAARVIATASGEDATALLRKLGADELIDSRSKAFVEQLRALVPEGVDAVLALAGGEALERCLDMVRAGGRVAYPNGVEPEPQPRPRVRLVSYDAEAGSRQFGRLHRAVEEAKLQVPIAAAFSLEDAPKAHERIERGHVLGRIVLEIRRDREGNNHDNET
jgi:NADPH:quinone reductase-like Zn-dependent oxidoreductase